MLAADWSQLSSGWSQPTQSRDRLGGLDASKEDLQLLKEAKENIAQGLWLDDGGPPPSEDQDLNLDQELFDFHPRKAARLDNQQQQPAIEQPVTGTPALTDAQAEPYNLATLPQPPVTMREDEQAAFHRQIHQQQQIQQHYTEQHTHNLHQQQQHYHDQRQININIDSPTYNRYGGPTSFGPVPPTPRHQRQAPYNNPATPTATPAPSTHLQHRAQSNNKDQQSLLVKHKQWTQWRRNSQAPPAREQQHSQ